jgi:hypothetical protein
MIYNKGNKYSILSHLKPEKYDITRKKNIINLSGVECKIGLNGVNNYSFFGRQVLFVLNHGGGLKSVLYKPSPVTVDLFHEKRFSLNNYINYIRSIFSLNLYENNKVLLMAVCFAAKKSFIDNKILAVEIAKRLRIHVIAADSLVNVTHDYGHTESKFQNGKEVINRISLIKDISTHGNCYKIDPLGNITLLQIAPCNKKSLGKFTNSDSNNNNPYRSKIGSR